MVSYEEIDTSDDDINDKSIIKDTKNFIQTVDTIKTELLQNLNISIPEPTSKCTQTVILCALYNPNTKLFYSIRSGEYIGIDFDVCTHIQMYIYIYICICKYFISYL